MFSRTQIQVIIGKLLLTQNKIKIRKIVESRHISDIVDIMINLMPAEQKQFLDLLFEMKLAGKTLIRLPKSLAQDLLEKKITVPGRGGFFCGRGGRSDSLSFMSMPLFCIHWRWIANFSASRSDSSAHFAAAGETLEPKVSLIL